MKKLFLFVAVMMAAVAFSSCSKDEDESPSIIGTWQITHSEGKEVDNSGKLLDQWSEDYPVFDEHENGFCWSYTFNNDGTCVSKTYEIGISDEDDNPQYYTYSISENKLIMTDQYGDQDIYEIKKLSSDQLILFYHNQNDYYTTEGTETYKRIK